MKVHYKPPISVSGGLVRCVVLIVVYKRRVQLGQEKKIEAAFKILTDAKEQGNILTFRGSARAVNLEFK